MGGNHTKVRYTSSQRELGRRVYEHYDAVFLSTAVSSKHDVCSVIAGGTDGKLRSVACGLDVLLTSASSEKVSNMRDAAKQKEYAVDVGQKLTLSCDNNWRILTGLFADAGPAANFVGGQVDSSNIATANISGVTCRELCDADKLEVHQWLQGHVDTTLIGEKAPYVLVVTGVLYATSLNITFHDKSKVKLGADVKTEGGELGVRFDMHDEESITIETIDSSIRRPFAVKVIRGTIGGDDTFHIRHGTDVAFVMPTSSSSAAAPDRTMEEQVRELQKEAIRETWGLQTHDGGPRPCEDSTEYSCCIDVDD